MIKRVVSIFKREAKLFYAKQLPAIKFKFSPEKYRDIYSVSNGERAVKPYSFKIHNLEVNPFSKIDWKKDYVSGTVFPDLRFGKFNTNLFFDKGADIKFPWDLSRCNFIPPMVSNLCAEGKTDEAYQLFKNTIESFINDNKFLYGVNWICTMEVSIRASNWLFAIPYFKQELAQDKEFSKKLHLSLFNHASYIDLFTEHKNNNHDISNYAGLILLGIYFGNEGWIKKAVDGLEHEMNLQIFEDGSCYELSTYYHRLDTEFFATSFYFGQLHNIKFSAAYIERLRKMFGFMFDLMEADGYMPMLNDNDGGRFVVFNDGSENDFSYLKNFYNKLFSHPVLADADSGNQLFNNLPEVVKIASPVLIDNNPVKYENSKFYKFSDSGFNVIVSGAEIRQIKKQGHKHVDPGAVYISIDRKPTFLDLGTSSYTRSLEQRNIDRSISSHNTVVPTGLIKKYTTKSGYWGKLPAYPEIDITRFEKGNFECVLDYNGEKVTRTIAITDGQLEISDVGTGSLSAFYHTDKSFSIDGNTLLFDDFTMTVTADEISTEECIYAARYGTLTPNAIKIILKSNSAIKIQIKRL
ncbi:MAG: hypothetical protein EOO45_00670 [Flavobacterium sp.]|nr:MAG: hypothetical protein EOO45_00670 [Flavobacterium sp.]